MKLADGSEKVLIRILLKFQTLHWTYSSLYFISHLLLLPTTVVSALVKGAVGQRHQMVALILLILPNYQSNLS